MVNFCTDSIRYEKVAIYMGELGIRHICRLEGGLLKYFEETGSPGYNCACFVFDKRMVLDPVPKPVG